jgi:hypothetical protein
MKFATIRLCAVLCSLIGLPACAGPTEPESYAVSMTQMTEDTLRSAAGPWAGIVGNLMLEFNLTQAPDGRVQGTGTMREGAAALVPIAVSGTYRRPNLSLTFTGMVFEGREVVGTFEGPYTSFTGVVSPLRLTAEGYSKSLSLLLSEGRLPSPSLGGRLTDAVTGSPVSGATVSVQGRTVTSSPTGHYGFDPNLAAGTFSLKVTHPSYIDLVRDVDVLPFAIVDFKLQPR